MISGSAVATSSAPAPHDRDRTRLAGCANFTVGISGYRSAGPCGWRSTTLRSPPRSGVPAEGSVKYRFQATASGARPGMRSSARNRSGICQRRRRHSGRSRAERQDPARPLVCRGTGLARSASFTTTVFGETPGQLPAPAGLVAKRDRVNQSVKLTWNAVAGATGYDVYRSSSASFGEALWVARKSRYGLYR